MLMANRPHHLFDVNITYNLGGEGGWEEYWDYIFPDIDGDSANIKLLQMAKMWKKQQDDSDSSSGADEEGD